MARVVDYDLIVEKLDEGKITAIAFPGDGSVRACQYSVADWSPLLDEDDADLREHHITKVILYTAEDDDACIQPPEL